MAMNIVEIVVRAKNMTQEGFAAADASTSTLGAKLSKIGLVATAGLAVAGVAATDMAMKFQSATTMLQTQAGVSASKLAQLRSGVLALAGQVGFSPDSLSEALYHVASNMQSLGATAPQMLSALKVAAQGAAVGHANLVDVTNALTAAIASGIPGVQNYSKAMGVLNATVGTGDMQMQDLADAFGTGMLAAVKGFGLSIKDVGAALATFGDNNIRGAKAGTDLRMAVMGLASPAKTGAAALAQLGLKSDTLAKDMQRGGLKLAMEDLVSHMHQAGLTSKQVGAVLTDAFGKKAGVGINILASQMDRFESKFPDLAKGANGFGKAWGNTQQTLSQKLKELDASFQALMITIGNKLIPVVSVVVGWLLKHKDVAVALAGVVAGLAAGLGILAVVIKTVEIATKAWQIAQVALDFVLSANPIGILIMAIAALVAVIVVAWNHSKTFRDVVKAAFRDVVHAVGAAIDWIKSHWKLLLVILTGPVGAAVLWIISHWRQITHVFSEVINWIRSHWTLILAILTGPVGLAVRWIIQHWDQLYQGTVNMVQRVVAWFRNLPRMILAAVGNLGSLLYTAGKNVIQGLINGILSMAGSVGHAIGGIVSDIRSFLPFSPAKKGPLSGAGSPDLAGKKIGQMLAGGLGASAPGVSAAMARVAGAAATGGVAAAGRSGPGSHLVVEFDFRGADQDMLRWLRKAIRVRGGNVQVVLGR